MRNVRKLFLPDGGAVLLPLPGGSGDVVETVGGSPVISSGGCPSLLVPVLAGAVLGGGLTWLIVRLSRP